MLKKVLKKIEKLNADKIKFIDEQSKIQKKINEQVFYCMDFMKNINKIKIMNKIILNQMLKKIFLMKIV